MIAARRGSESMFRIQSAFGRVAVPFEEKSKRFEDIGLIVDQEGFAGLFSHHAPIRGTRGAFPLLNEVSGS